MVHCMVSKVPMPDDEVTRRKANEEEDAAMPAKISADDLAAFRTRDDAPLASLGRPVDIYNVNLPGGQNPTLVPLVAFFVSQGIPLAHWGASDPDIASEATHKAGGRGGGLAPYLRLANWKGRWRARRASGVDRRSSDGSFRPLAIVGCAGSSAALTAVGSGGGEA